MIKIFKWMSLLSLLLLVGCPAPSDSDTDDKTGGALEVGLNLTMSISSTDEISNKIPTNDDAKVDMLFLDAARVPLSDKIINILATSGTLSQTSVLTDQEGRATVTISSPSGLTTGTAPGIFTATPEAVGDEASDDLSEAEKEAHEKVNEPVTLNYEFVATTVAETPDEAAKFASSLQFISADPTFLSLKGTGGVGYGEISKLVFKVVDNEGNPVSGVQVDFKLTTTVGGLDLNSESATSNAQGEVFVTVLAGTISTPVRVTASVVKEDGSLLSVQSDKLTVTTGIPDQNSFSLSVVKLAPEAANFEGNEVEFIIRSADRNNNPVPDGTVINFTTEGGAIEGSCETVAGACFVIWTSQDPRPLDHRMSVLAYAIGHETFYDKNGSGIFDDGDTFDDLGEAFRNDDESRNDDGSETFNPEETSFSQDEKLIDYDENLAYTDGDRLYNGVPCNHSTDCPIDANNIAGRSNLLVNVRESGMIIMASSYPNVHIYELLPGSGTCLDDNNKLAIDVNYDSTDPNSVPEPLALCLPVTQNFTTGIDVKSLWVLIEDTKALCLDAEDGDRIEGVVNPNSPQCIYPIRQSSPTDSSISVTSDVGELSKIMPDSIPNTLAAFEFTFTVSSLLDNEEAVFGRVSVEVTTPSTNTVSGSEAFLWDPIN